MLLLIEKPVDSEKIAKMMEALGHYIKIAVDVQRGILAGGGIMHADCESLLLENGSKQRDIWGADWYPKEKKIEFQSLINIRPMQDNKSMQIKDEKIRALIERIVRELLDK